MDSNTIEICIIIVVVIVIVLYINFTTPWAKIPTYSFFIEKLTTPASPPTDFQNELSFLNAHRARFASGAPTPDNNYTAGQSALFVSPNIDMTAVRSAFAGGSTQMPALEIDYSEQINTSDTCSTQYPTPASIPPRPPKTAVGCGWWQGTSPAPSFAAFGSAAGPANLSIAQADPTGTWFWNATAAQQANDIALCNQMTICDALAGSKFSGQCGWCPTSLNAVPVYTNGTIKYASAACAGGAAPIMTAGACPLPPTPPPPPPESLPTDPATGAPTVPPAAPIPGPQCAISGPISETCLLSLATSAGIGAGSPIMILVTTGSPPNYAMFVDAMGEIASLIGSGSAASYQSALTIGTATISALNLMTTIIDIQKSPQASQQQQAAASYLVNANASQFDPCNLGPTVEGVFIVQCLQRLWRSAGCQAAGSSYPGSPTTDWGGGKTLPQMSAEYTALYNAMNSPNGKIAGNAINQCLGVSFDLRNATA